MHEDELALDEAVAARLIAGRFPELSDRELRPLLASGTVNRIIRVGDRLVARFPRQGADREELRREAAALDEFVDVSPVAAPRPYGIGAATPDYPSAWSVQTWVEGYPADPERFADSARLAHDLAALIVALRATDLHGRVFDGQGRGGALPDHDDWLAECFTRSGHLVDVPRAAALWQALRAIPAAGADVMSHRDLTPFNLLVRGDGESARLIGVLDGGGFGPADRALDLVAAWHLFDAPARRQLRDGVAAEDGEWLRGAAWALQQAMGLVWYYENTSPDLSALGRSTMRRLLADPELSALLD